ncbi:MAG TPA: YegS/Rv2252/BmrU family lipid kinase [Pyrinomonadaceae bacterium]|nr:YegS/Rv2252/BmrU family lipid kinase [Pyrinomonadaceae bacterium]
MQTLVIVNQVAAKARRAAPAVREKLSAAQIDFEIYETTCVADATDRTRSALLSGVTTIAVVGGDGTLSEAAQGFFEFAPDPETLPAPINPRAALAILPAGTGDDFARGLMGTRASLDRWIEILIKHCRDEQQTTKSCDVIYGRCDNYDTPFICINASTMGIGGETAARVASQSRLVRRCSGEVRFALAAVRSLMAWRERRVRITTDNQSYEGNMNLAAVANGLYAGGGMMLSPAARVDDGKLDVVTASGLSRVSILRELSRIHEGGHVANPNVRIIQGLNARIETFKTEDAMLIEADGNVRGVTPVSFRVMPAALKFVWKTD